MSRLSPVATPSPACPLGSQRSRGLGSAANGIVGRPSHQVYSRNYRRFPAAGPTSRPRGLNAVRRRPEYRVAATRVGRATGTTATEANRATRLREVGPSRSLRKLQALRLPVAAVAARDLAWRRWSPPCPLAAGYLGRPPCEPHRGSAGCSVTPPRSKRSQQSHLPPRRAIETGWLASWA